MSEKKIVVPEGMLEAARKESVKWFNYPAPGSLDRDRAEALASKIAEVCCQSISENPIVPTLPQMRTLKTVAAHEPQGSTRWLSNVLTEWQRRMFDVPKTEVPEAVKDMLLQGSVETGFFRLDTYNEKIIEAYRRGKEGK